MCACHRCTQLPRVQAHAPSRGTRSVAAVLLRVYCNCLIAHDVCNIISVVVALTFNILTLSTVSYQPAIQSQTPDVPSVPKRSKRTAITDVAPSAPAVPGPSRAPPNFTAKHTNTAPSNSHHCNRPAATCAAQPLPTALSRRQRAAKRQMRKRFLCVAFGETMRHRAPSSSSSSRVPFHPVRKKCTPTLFFYSPSSS